MFSIILRLSLLLIVCGITDLSAQVLPYKNANLPIDQRVNDLIARLTLEEKIKQMMHESPAITRLNIPKYNWWNECLHGVGRSSHKVTVFPQAIALAASFDVGGMEQMGDITSTEARAIYNEATRIGKEGDQYKGLTFWTPNINIFRDPRWGRGQETYGEDPYLTSVMGMAIVNGLQGRDARYLKTSACAKHYAVHSGPEKGRHAFNSNVSAYDLWDTYLPAFKSLVVEAKVSSVMCAYNRYDGQACCANDLLTRILRNFWNFSGYVTSDCGAISDFHNHHKTHANAATSSVDAVVHGTDLECGNDYVALIEAVRRGDITEHEINLSLQRLFSIRFRLGMFDNPDNVPYSKITINTLESPTHQEHALKMARESIVLLKNNNLLPLSKTIKRIAILGPNADNEEVQLGNYNGYPTKTVTVYKAIQAKLEKGAQIIYDPAIDYTKTLPNKTNLEKIVDKVKNADVIIFVGGISPRLEGEEGDAGVEKLEGFESGDRTDISLPAIQTLLLKKLKATGKPVILVNMSGSAVAFLWEANNLDGILQAWYGGQSAGTAVADILFGDYNPSGRLPITFYKSTKDLPDFNNYAMTNRTYRYFTGEVLYPFGYGLSYAQFEYSKINMNNESKTGESVSLSVTVHNTSSRDGSEIVQLYVQHPSALGPHPLHSLQGFKRIYLKAHESIDVQFTLTPQNLALVDATGNLTQVAGITQIHLGGGQPGVNTISTSLKIEGG